METEVRKRKDFSKVEEALLYLQQLYNESCFQIKRDFSDIVAGRIQDPLTHDAPYPSIGMRVNPENLNNDTCLSFGAVAESGFYGTTVTRPDIFFEYYREQLTLLVKRHNVILQVGLSNVPIPLPFVIDHASLQLDAEQASIVQNGFVLPNLGRIDDSVANGLTRNFSDIKPLSLFTAERVDFSLHRLQHYTATSPIHFQSFILLTNYQRYVDEFIAYGREKIAAGEDQYSELIGPGNEILAKNTGDINPLEKRETHGLPQMPAYHLKRPDGQGITFINIGVGPSNAKTITDHLAVLRPHCWLMLGHCAGLRPSQMLGDYVLAHGYVREDHVLDQDLPTWVPIPPLAEIQVALQKAAKHVSGAKGAELKVRMRTGTLVTTDDRNWELRSHALYNERFKQSRAIAVDMESATVAANGFRFRVPYGTLLCVSDKPLHGEIKLQGMANAFYRERVRQHLQVGLESVRLLREDGVDKLHSRKLRGFDDPPFR